jgi:hypothetical protein
MASDPGAPDWYSHGLNRVAYYRLATVAATTPPRPTRVLTLNFFDAWSPPGGNA